MLPLLITSVNEEAESYNGGEDHSRGMQQVWSTLAIANDDRRWEHMGWPNFKTAENQQRRCIFVGL